MKIENRKSMISILAIVCTVFSSFASETSEFNEELVQSLQQSSSPPQEFELAVQAFEVSSDPVVKAQKWEDAVNSASRGLLGASWASPSGGWKLLNFPAEGVLTLNEVKDQGLDQAYFTKIVAQNETEVAKLRASGNLLSTAVLEGEAWAEKLLLKIATGPDGNLKRLTYWVADDFAQDWQIRGESETQAPWPVNWNDWQAAYSNANLLGKAIILRNVGPLAARRGEYAAATAIHLDALSGGERELKALALAYGDSELGPAIIGKWAEIAAGSSDPLLKALALEAQRKFAISE